MTEFSINRQQWTRSAQSLVDAKQLKAIVLVIKLGLLTSPPGMAFIASQGFHFWD